MISLIFFYFSSCVMLLFEHKQHLQSCDAQSSMQREILSFTALLIDPRLKSIYQVTEVQMTKRLRVTAHKK